VAEESNEKFWKFVDVVIPFHMYRVENSARDLHGAALKAATIAMGNENLKLNLFKFALSLHMYSPKIEMFDQVNRQTFEIAI